MENRSDSESCDYLYRGHKLCLMLNDILVLVNSTVEPDEIMSRIMVETAKGIGCDSARIAIRENDQWVTRYTYQLPDHLKETPHSDEELPHASLAMITRRPVAIDDAFNDSRTNAEIMKSLGIRSVLVLPLMEQERVIGVLFLNYHSKRDVFDEFEIEYAEKVATAAAIALQKGRHYQEQKQVKVDLEQRQKYSDALTRIENIIYTTHSTDEIFKKVLQHASQVIGAESAMIFTKEGGHWVVRQVSKLSRSLLGRSFSNDEVKHTAITAVTKEPLAIVDTEQDDRVNRNFTRMLQVRSLLDFPLLVKGEVIGDLVFHYHSNISEITEHQVNFIRNLQNSLSLALENARLFEALKLSESRLKEAERIGRSGYFHYDRNTGRMTWSDGLFAIFGRDPSLGEPGFEEVANEYCTDQRCQETRERVAREGADEFDVTIEREGIPVQLQVTVRSVKGDQGNTTAFHGTVHDVTEPKRTENELRKSKEQYEATAAQLEAVIGSMNDAVVIADLQGNIRTLNPTALRIYGFSEMSEGLMPLTEYQKLLVVTDLDGNAHPLQEWPMSRAIKGEVFTNCEIKLHVRKTGRTVIGNYSGTPVRDHDGNNILALVTIRDVTEQKQTENNLRISEMNYRTIFNSVYDAIFIHEVETGAILDVNDRMLEMYKYTREEAANLSVLDISADPNVTQQDVVKLVRSAASEGPGLFDWLGKDKTGRLFWVEVSLKAVVLEGKNRVLAVVRDISDRKQAEEEVKRLNVDLAAHAADLQAFNYTVAHDLRKPLTVINGYCQIMQELCAGILDEQCRSYLEKTYEGTLRMNQLIDALLNFSRLAAVEVRHEAVDLSALAREVVKELKAAEPDRQVTFRISERIVADGDKDLLRVVLDNLMGNAWKFISTRKEGVVEFGATQMKGETVFFIRDNGQGFDMGDAEQIFMPFKQLGEAENQKGFGIGLATTKRIIERHGGRIWAESRPGEGATFYFTLPGHQKE